MRTLVTVAFAVVAGVHCSAPPYSGEEAESAEPTASSTEEPGAPGNAPRAEPVSGQGTERTETGWAIEAPGLPPTLFTSTVRGDDGALYAAGTFAGWLTVGGDTVKSKGADDVVLVRVDADGRVAWVKSIGSTLSERAPKVTFVDGTVRILAETEGRVDCGAGEMGRWSSGMFFYCLYAIDGATLGGGAFPTGAP
jgi:hypothetical protein